MYKFAKWFPLSDTPFFMRKALSTCLYTLFLLLTFLVLDKSALCDVYVGYTSSHGFEVLGVPEFTAIETSSDHQTVNITIENNQAIWYGVTTVFVGSGPAHSNIPSAFDLGPHETRRFTNVRFNGSDRLSFRADATDPSASGMMAIDVLHRAFVGSPLPTSDDDAIFEMLTGNTGLAGTTADLAKSIRDNNLFGAMSAIAEIGKNDYVQSAFLLKSGHSLPSPKAFEWFGFALSVAYILDVPVETGLANLHNDMWESVTFDASAIKKGGSIAPPSTYDNAGYVTEGTPGDDTAFSPNQTYTKSWTITNNGTSTWGSGYRWTFDGGDQMGGPDSIPVPTVHPGETWTPIINLRAPSIPRSSSYCGYWRMQAPNNSKFGTSVHVQIKVPISSENVGTFVSEDSSATAPGLPGFWQYGTASYWNTASGVGDGGQMLWTYNNDASHGTNNMADWRPNLPATTAYEVFVYIPRLNATTTQAHYRVYYAGGQADVYVNQNSYSDAWVSLGTYQFNGGTGGYLRLIDQTNEGYATKRIGFDAAKWEARSINADIGYGSSEQSYFLDCFERNGDRDAVGSPINNTHWWGTNSPVVIQDFRGGSGGDGAIIDNEGTSHTTAYFVHGSIWDEYASVGGPDSPLRKPLSDEEDAAPSWSGLHGRDTLFEGGVIKNSIYGAFEIYGAIADKYNNMSNSGGVLGFPYSEQGNAPTSPQGTQGQVQWFEGGAVYASNFGANEVGGAIYNVYEGLGGSSSVLGFPTSDEIDAIQSPQNSQGRLNHFEGGEVYYSYQHGGYPVYGAIKDKFDAAGGTAGVLGFPTSDPVVGDHGPQQSFEGGTIYANIGVTLTITPDTTTAGQESPVLTVTIDQAAPSGGVTIPLSTSNRDVADPPDSVTVPAGSKSVNYYIGPGKVGSSGTATVSAPGFGTAAQATLTVSPQTLALASLTITPTTIAAGDTAQGIATFNGPSPVDGSYFIIKSSDSKVVSTNLFVLIPKGASSVTFTTYSWAVTAQTQIIMTGWVLGAADPVTLTVPMTVNPVFTVKSLSLSPNPVTGGSSTVTGIVALDSPAPNGGVTLNLSSNDTTAATVPTSIVIPEGSSSASFNVLTNVVSASHDVTITASGGGNASQQAVLKVYPVAVPTSISFTPLTVVGGGDAKGLITINRPADANGATIVITSGNKAAVDDTQVVIAPGTTSANFTVPTSQVVAPVPVDISATTGGETQTATLTVIPGIPNLSATAVLSRTTSGLLATVTINNSGNGDASNVIVKSTVLGSSATTDSTPISLGTIVAGDSKQVTLHFSSLAAATRARTKLGVDGVYTGGAFSIGMRVQSP